MGKLTNLKIEKLKPKEKIYKANDGQGLYLKIRPSGSKIWMFDYYHPITKKRPTLTIGRYPDISLKEARELITEYRGLVAKGIDPKEYLTQIKEQKETEINNTFIKIASDWYEWRKTRKHFSAGYAVDVWRMLEKHTFPSLQDKPITSIKPRDIINTLNKLKEDGKNETIKRTLQHIRAIMDYAINRGMLDVNPCESLKKEFDSPTAKHYPTIKPSELPKLLAMMKYANIKETTRRLFMWQLLTMTRPTETASAKFEDIDEKQCLWTVTINKGTERGRKHKVTLPRQAMELLNEIKQEREANGSKSPYLFPGVKSPFIHMRAETLNRVFRRNGYKGRLVAHGLRSIASTYLNEKGIFHYDLVEVALSHLNNDKVRMAYNRAEYLPQRLAMLQDWADYIEACSNQ